MFFLYQIIVTIILLFSPIILIFRLIKKKEEDFNIESGVANIPTAFIASYGNGLPIIAILGEYDELPGLSQQRVPYQISAGG